MYGFGITRKENNIEDLKTMEERKSQRKVTSTTPTHRRTDANLYPLERQLTKASDPSFDLEGGQSQI